MRFGNYDFQPTLVPTLVVAICLAFLLWLGFWQLDRADEKQALVNSHEKSKLEMPIPLNDSLEQNWQSIHYRPLEVYGRYDLDNQLLLDNKTHQGKAGYHVLTPFIIDGSEKTLLVNRGWLAGMSRREDRPKFTTPAGKLTLKGVVEFPPDKHFRLSDEEEPRLSGPRVIQEIRMDLLEQRLARSLLPIIMLLDPGDPSGFVREWKPLYNSGPEQNHAYALQWFSFALILLVIFVLASSKRVDK